MSIDQAHTSPKWRRSTFGRFARVFNGSDYRAVEVDSGGYPVYGSGGEFRRASDYLFEGESVLFGRKGTIDRPLYVNGRFWTVDTMFYTDIDTRALLPRYAYYWATTLPYGEWATDTALPSMTSTAIKAAPIVVPPMVEQRAIADFLDRETAQIDALIHKQAQLITLLRERRQSIIDEAFTVDDGRIPTRVRRLLAVRPSYGVLVPQYVDDDQEGVPLIRVGDLTSLDIESGSLLSISEEQSAEYSRTRLAGGEVLLGVVGKMGQAAVVPSWLAGANVARAVCVLRCRSHLASALLAEWLGSTHFLHQASEATSGDTIQPTLGMADLGRFTVNWPQDEVEGRRMAKYLEERTTAVDGLIAKAKELGELARERRAALISAAVTGKIDVGVSA